MVEEKEPIDALRDLVWEHYGDPYTKELDMERFLSDLTEVLGEEGWYLIGLVMGVDVDYVRWHYREDVELPDNYTRFLAVGILERIKKRILEEVE